VNNMGGKIKVKDHKEVVKEINKKLDKEGKPIITVEGKTVMEQTKKIRTVVEPKPKDKLLAVILKEGKSSYWKWVDFKQSRFKHSGNTYFIEPSGIYLSTNNILYSTYLEGVTMPISHSNLVVQTEEVKYNDPITKEEKTETISYIGNIKVDSKIANILLDRHLADEFTKEPMDTKGAAMFILLIGIVILGIANIVVGIYG